MSATAFATGLFQPARNWHMAGNANLSFINLGGSTHMPRECRHEVRELTGQERLDMQLGHGHVWLFCRANQTFNFKSIPGIVCRSNGCNPGCPKFVSVSDGDSAGDSVNSSP